MTTIDTITDEQIYQLAREAEAAGDYMQVMICDIAMASSGDKVIRVARAECARIINEAEALRDEQ